MIILNWACLKTVETYEIPGFVNVTKNRRRWKKTASEWTLSSMVYMPC